MNSPVDLHSMISRMIEVGAPRAQNRARINSVFNGDNPKTDQEAQADHDHTNTNFLDGTEVIHRARQQCTNALMSPSNFFTVTLESGPLMNRAGWGDIITDQIRRIMKGSRLYRETIKSSISQMVLHGIGPSTWMDCEDWCPMARGIDDLLIPSNTLVSLRNLTHFGIKITFTVAELIKFTSGKYVDPGWNKELVATAIQSLKVKKFADTGSGGYDSYRNPEKWVEDLKENSVYFGSDAVPVLHCYDFYFYDSEADEPCWKRRILVDRTIEGMANADFSNTFLYSSERSYGTDVSNILHAQIADGAVVAPARWHSVRSLGYLLYRPCHLQNRLRSRFFDSVFESMNWYFHNVQEGDRERIEKVDLRHLGIIPAGLSWVPANERHHVNFELLNGAMTMNQQLIGEFSSSYTRDSTSSTKERTATEVLTQAHQAAALLNSMLVDIYDDQIPQYKEICRRLCTTDHPDSKKFRTRCMALGVDQAVFDVESWNIQPEKTIGGGSKVLQIATAEGLMKIRGFLSPQSQSKVDHYYVEAISSDPAMARDLVPLEEQKTTSSQEKATLAWGTLMDGKPVVFSNDTNRYEIIETWIKMLAMEFKAMQDGAEHLDEHRIIGIGNVINSIKAAIQQVASDETQIEKIKAYLKLLNQFETMLTQAAQLVVDKSQQDQVQQPQIDPKIQAQMQAKVIEAQANADIAEKAAEQKRQHKEIAFQQEQRRRDAKTANDINAMGARTQVELAGAQARNIVNQ